MLRKAPGLVTLLVCVWPGSVSSEPVDADRWIPAITGGVFVTGFAADGSIESSLRQSASDDDSQNTPALQLGLELMTPALQDWPMSPRLVGAAGMLAGPDDALDLASAGKFVDGQPEESVAQALANPNDAPADPASFPGQGSEATATLRPFGWFTSIGVLLDLPEPLSLFRLKPNISYVGQSVYFRGKLVSVTGEEPDFVVHRVSDSGIQFFHYIGPALEAEMVLGDRLSFFAHFGYLWQIGDDTLALRADGVTFRYANDVSEWRGGAGIRVRLHGLLRGS